MPEQKSYGLLIEPLSTTDYVAGDGNLKGEVINPEGDWTPFIPKFEHQAPLFETNSCASQGTLNALEILHKFIYGEEANLSDRMVAKGSGTDPRRGNSPQKVGYFVHKNWSALEEDWPMQGVQTVDEYYQPLPAHLFSKAKTVQADNEFGYEAITNPTKLRLKDALTRGTVGISVKAWAQDENGLYYSPPGWTDNHWCTLLNIRPDGNYTILDSYSPYIKVVRGDHVPAIAYRYALNEEAVDYITLAIKAIKDFIASWKPASPDNRLKLYHAAKAALGTDASPSDSAPDELGCAETWNEIYKNAFGSYLYEGNRNATHFLYKALKESPKFLEVTAPIPGDTVISPTGYGRNPAMPNGHVGIVMQQGIASNDSRTGTFVINYTLGTWKSKYVEKGLYPMKFYRPV